MDTSILLSIIGALFTVSMLLIGVVFGIIMSRLTRMETDLLKALQELAALKAMAKARRADDLT